MLEVKDSTNPPPRPLHTGHRPSGVHTGFTGQHLPFVGFTYTTDSCFSDRGSVGREAMPDGSSVDGGGGGGEEVEAFESRIRRLEQEKQELNRKLQGERRGGEGGGERGWFTGLVALHVCMSSV